MPILVLRVFLFKVVVAAAAPPSPNAAREEEAAGRLVDVVVAFERVLRRMPADGPACISNVRRRALSLLSCSGKEHAVVKVAID